tara:strand:+ start:3714 stop:4646 length:933 start_codon:yes stop_codon:yes gene_type:complete
MKILVTGGAGYIGSVLVPRLLSENYAVTVLDNFLFNQVTLTESCKNDKFDIIRGDTRDTSLLKDIIQKFDVIIPLAALVGAPMCDLDKLGAESINKNAIEEIVRLTSNEQKILMPVTNSGYGIGEKNKFCDETSPLNPISLYGITKVKAEEAVLSRENSVTFRLATVFGMSSRMRTDLLVNDFVYRAVNDRTLVIFEGHFKRNYIHIQDVANVFIHAINNFDNMRGKAFNVGLDEANLSKIELATIIKEHIPNFVFLEAPIGEDPDKRDYIVSNKRLLDSGFITEWSMNRGIKELIKGYKIIKNSSHSNV